MEDIVTYFLPRKQVYEVVAILATCNYHHLSQLMRKFLKIQVLDWKRETNANDVNSL